MRILFFLLLFPLLSPAQIELPLPILEDSLNALGKTLITSRDLEARKTAAQEIFPMLNQHAASPEGFAYPFDSIAYLSIQQPEDASFKIISWQLYVDENTYQYFGAIQLAEQGKFIPLNPSKEIIEDPEFDQLDADQWMSAIYYNIKEFTTKKGKAYLLFGFNGHSLFQRQKIVDVLEIQDGEIQFGSPVFFMPDGKRAHKQRIVLTYSATANVNCNYDPNLEKVIFDHLIVGAGPDGKPTLVPDGSYEAYEFKQDRWVFEEKVFHEISETAPRPKPVLDQKAKDIFGKEKKQKQNPEQPQKQKQN